MASTKRRDPRVDDDSGRCRPGDHAAEDAVADLLQHELGGGAVADRAVLGQRDGERDEEERDADPVVQPGLDVEALADAGGKAWRRDDRLAERRVGRREDDREEQRLGPREIAEERDAGDEAGEDRERQPDPEQARRYPERPPKRLQVDARRIGEEDDRERRLGERLDLDARRRQDRRGRAPRRRRRARRR